MNKLNAPTKRDWLNGYNKSCIYVVYKRPISDLGTHRDWKWGNGKKDFCATENQKKAGAAILLSDKIDFKIKTVTRNKEGHYIAIRESIQEEDITL